MSAQSVYAARVMSKFDEIDRALGVAGVPPLTPFWHAQLERLYSHPTATTLVARVGRGGAKSHTATKVGLFETLIGEWKVPAGERHFFAFVSKNRDEANQRLNMLQVWLRALGVHFNASGEEIALNDLPRGLRVFACNVGAVSGFRCFGFSADELSKWTAGSDYSNPAGEVCASLNAMAVTHPRAHKLLISSPLGTLDYHAERMALGA